VPQVAGAVKFSVVAQFENRTEILAPTGRRLGVPEFA